jgi:predicted ATPase/DNA-binding SARP family transcriptional activator
MNERIKITLFGGLSVRQGDRIITRFKSQKIGALLAYLAYHLRPMHAREVLIDLFWPESTLEAGRNSLSVALSSLRHQLEPPGTPASAIIRADRFSVGLNPAAVTTDVAEFEAVIKAAAKAGSTTEQIQFLTQAADLYQGRLLPGFYEEWITAEQERLAGLFFDASDRLIAHLEAAGDMAAAMQYARRAIALDPLREEAHGSLMRLLAAADQPGAALRQYREMERLLEEELGVEPSASLRALARRIEKESGLTAPPVLPPAAVIPAKAGTRRAPVAAPAAVTPQPGVMATVNFLMTDIEGSTRLWEQAGDAFRDALATHHSLLRAEFARHGGQEIKEAGDSFLVAFPSARSALACAVACQKALQNDEGGRMKDEEDQDSSFILHPSSLRVRMALHTGDVEWKDGEYHGLALHRLARMLTAAHGGQILVSEATAGLLRRDPDEETRLTDLGVWRLRDVPELVRLFQAEYPGMPAQEFGPLAAEAGYAGNLPMRFTRFFGRNEEIERLTELLLPTTQRPNDPTTRLITLTGPGGTGKTRLAVEVADLLAERFNGAVWFATFAVISNPNLIADTILDAMRLPRSPQREPLEQVVEALNRQPSLLVLDNFEHLLGDPTQRRKDAKKGAEGKIEQPAPNGAEIAQHLLKRVPTLTLLVTSRRLLGLSGEREFPVPPLPTPNTPPQSPPYEGGAQGGWTPEHLTMYDSVRLFVDRAQAAMPHFQVTNRNAPTVAELCSRLEGIPLAIELAAARALVMTPAQMLAQLQNRFDFLASRKRDADERHRSLQAAVEWSYRLLAPEVRRFFCRLSVFRGGWTVEAAEAVCEEPLALDYLAQLRECSLALTEETEQGIRFRMMETLREFGWELLNAEQRAEMRRRHLEWLLALAQESSPHLEGPEQGVWFDRLDAEFRNLCAALDWAISEGSGVETGLQITCLLGAFLHFRDHWPEAYRFPCELLARGGERLPEHLRAQALDMAGSSAWHQRYNGVELATARALLEEGLSLSRRLGDRTIIAGTLCHLSFVVGEQGDLPAARACLEEALILWQESGDPLQIGATLLYLGNLARREGDHSGSRTLIEQSLTTLRPTGNPAYIGDALYDIADVVDDYAYAQSCLDEAIVLWESIGRMTGVAHLHERKAKLAARQGDLITASRYYRAWLQILRKLDVFFSSSASGWINWLAPTLREVASGLDRAGLTALEEGRIVSSRSQLQESLRLWRELGERSGLAVALETLARVEQAQFRYERAAGLCGAAAALRSEANIQRTAEEQATHEARRGEIKQALGEEAFAAAWEAGCAMTWEEAIAYALEEESA